MAARTSTQKKTKKSLAAKRKMTLRNSPKKCMERLMEPKIAGARNTNTPKKARQRARKFPAAWKSPKQS